MSRTRQSRRASGALPAAMLLASLGAVGAALVSQHMFGMEPCPWCVLQRLVFVAIAAAALLALLWRSVAGQRIGGLLALALAGCGTAAALWQHFVAAATNSCKLSLAEKIISGLGLDGSLPEIFAPRATCADAAVKLLGLPYEFWSLGLFLLLAAGSVALLRRR